MQRSIHSLCRRWHNQSKRLFSASSSQNNSEDNSHRWFQAGAFLLGLVVLEQGWYSYQDYTKRSQFQSTLSELQHHANTYSQAKVESHQEAAATLPTLFTCRVVQTDPSLSGTLMLQSVTRGDLVEVVTAEVGPDQAYHLCRYSNDNSDDNQTKVGWYPREFLKRVE